MRDSLQNENGRSEKKEAKMPQRQQQWSVLRAMPSHVVGVIERAERSRTIAASVASLCSETTKSSTDDHIECFCTSFLKMLQRASRSSGRNGSLSDPPLSSHRKSGWSRARSVRTISEDDGYVIALPFPLQGFKADSNDKNKIDDIVMHFAFRLYKLNRSLKDSFFFRQCFIAFKEEDDPNEIECLMNESIIRYIATLIVIRNMLSEDNFFYGLTLAHQYPNILTLVQNSCNGTMNFLDNAVKQQKFEYYYNEKSAYGTEPFEGKRIRYASPDKLINGDIFIRSYEVMTDFLTILNQKDTNGRRNEIKELVSKINNCIDDAETQLRFLDLCADQSTCPEIELIKEETQSILKSSATSKKGRKKQKVKIGRVHDHRFLHINTIPSELHDSHLYTVEEHQQQRRQETEIYNENYMRHLYQHIEIVSDLMKFVP